MSAPFTVRQPPQFPLHPPMSRLLHFPSHSNDCNSNATVFTAPNVDNVHCYKLVQLARVQIAYLDPSLHLVSTLHSLGFFLCPDSPIRLCSPALALAPSNSHPDSSVRALWEVSALAHSDSFRVLTRPSVCALQPLPTWILSASCLV